MNAYRLLTTMPHLHLQVQTHVDLWDPDDRSVPFGFEPDGRVLAATTASGRHRAGRDPQRRPAYRLLAATRDRGSAPDHARWNRNLGFGGRGL